MQLGLNPLAMIVLVGLVVPAAAIGRFVVSVATRRIRGNQNSTGQTDKRPR